MQVFEKEGAIFFDVDDTLIMHNQDPNHDLISIICPYTKDNIWVKPHNPHIRLLLEKHARGYPIIVWSQGGYAWAKAVIETLNLQPYVHLVMSKPSLIVDDLPAEAWLHNRLYMDPDKRYKE